MQAGQELRSKKRIMLSPCFSTFTSRHEGVRANVSRLACPNTKRPPGASKPIRSQGTFIDDKEIRESVRMVKGLAEAQYEPELVQIKSKINLDADGEQDEMFEDAVKVILETKRGSVSLLQRRLSIGYGRAARLIEMMAAAGILGEYKGSQARECTMSLEDWEQLKAARQADQDSGMSV